MQASRLRVSSRRSDRGSGDILPSVLDRLRTACPGSLVDLPDFEAQRPQAWRVPGGLVEARHQHRRAFLFVSFPLPIRRECTGELPVSPAPPGAVRRNRLDCPTLLPFRKQGVLIAEQAHVLQPHGVENAVEVVAFMLYDTRMKLCCHTSDPVA